MPTTGQLGTPASRLGAIMLGALEGSPTAPPTKMAATMDGLAGLLAVIAPATGQVFAWPVESITPPAIIVGYPTRWDFDMTMARGADEYEIPVWVAVGKSSTMTARNAVSDILSEAGSVKSILDGQHVFGAYTVDVRVTNAAVSELTVGGVPYLAARFDCEVYG